jgi:hypothetical protein
MNIANGYCAHGDRYIYILSLLVNADMLCGSQPHSFILHLSYMWVGDGCVCAASLSLTG